MHEESNNKTGSQTIHGELSINQVQIMVIHIWNKAEKLQAQLLFQEGQCNQNPSITRRWYEAQGCEAEASTGS